MAISHLSIVNQKLVYAGTLLGLATAINPSSTPERLKLQALVDSALLHLGLAYVFYLRELGENYRLKHLSSINRAEQLAVALAAANKSPSEAQELILLEQDSQSWLNAVLAAYDSLQRSPEPEKVQKAFPVDGLISVVDVSDAVEQSSPVSANHLAIWLSEFRALVVRQRDTSAEF